MGIEEDSRAQEAINALKSGEFTPQGKNLRELALLHIDFAINEANTADSEYGKKVLEAANLCGWMADYVEIIRNDTTTDKGVPVTFIEARHPYYLEPFAIASIAAIPVEENLVLVLEKFVNPLPKFRSKSPIIRESASCNQVNEPEVIIRRFLTEKPNETFARVVVNTIMPALSKFIK
jgi:hypothetical protein